MLSTSTNFETANDLLQKVPVYLVHFAGLIGIGSFVNSLHGSFVDTDHGVFVDSEVYDYSTWQLGTTTYQTRQYVKSISGLSQSITPEEGRSSISSLKISIVDIDDSITALIATDANYFHRKKVTVKDGYIGMDEADMLTIASGWITDMKLSSDLLAYEFTVSDPQKWMQRKVFRDARDAEVIISGNPLNILLNILTSTGNATNGDNDIYIAANGLGIDVEEIDVTGIKAIRDNWFPGTSFYMSFTINEPIVAKDFFQDEIFKVLNLYPVILGNGKFSVRVFKPPLPTIDEVQSFTNDNIVGYPSFDFNLGDLYNEVEFHYDWDSVDEEFDVIDSYADSTSINARGPGKKEITIKSKGLNSSKVDAETLLASRKASIFNRFSVPPIKITASTFFTQMLSETGDIVPVTHPLLPDIESGSRGFSATRMEIIKRDIDWKNGKCKYTFLNTGFEKSQYAVISPVMTVVTGTSATEFEVSTSDAAKFANLSNPVVDILRPTGKARSTNKAISGISGTTVTIADIGFTPSAGYFIVFSSYDNATEEQQKWWFFCDSNNKLGAANDDAHLILP